MENVGYLKVIKDQYSAEKIDSILESFRRCNVLVIGDAIIDEYHFTIPKGRATKDPILSVDYVNHEKYAGGAMAVANHVSNFVNEVQLVTMLGERHDQREFIMGSLNTNVVKKFFVKKNAPTTVKRRYLNKARNEKLFKVEVIDDRPITQDLEDEICAFLSLIVPAYDLVMVGDFGHSMITPRIIQLLEDRSSFLAVNAQSNSANLGFNYITKYQKPGYVSMDELELRYAMADRFGDILDLMDLFYDKSGFQRFLITLGSMGSAYSHNGSTVACPAFVSRPRDTIGAGDAAFSVTSLFAHAGEDKLIPFIANCAGGVAVEYIGNKESVTKEKIRHFINDVFIGHRHEESLVHHLK